MATPGYSGGDDGESPRSSWRYLDAEVRFNILLNHYGNAAALSDATGLSTRQLRSIFQVLRSGRTSHVLQRDDVRQGIRRARHRMTDAIRRRIQSARDGKYIAPIFRGPETVLQPERYSLNIQSRDMRGKIQLKVVDSFWISYHVEHLPIDEIFRIAKQQFDTFSDTGQFNAFRFEYIANEAIYSEGEVFQDEGLYRQAQDSQIIKLSTKTMPFANFRGNPDYFEKYIRDEWHELKLKGGIRIVDLNWTTFEDLQKVAAAVRKDYLKYKASKARGKNGKRKKGDGFA